MEISRNPNPQSYDIFTETPSCYLSWAMALSSSFPYHAGHVPWQIAMTKGSTGWLAGRTWQFTSILTHES